ncbi:MAG: dephospho-CoA kinase [Firmicutes bacterium]|nr:dephospho-CoA kinase [Dethiobacter sp.]MBS3889002.1 dephospho-CoA kinase [Bacillota bacterium]MBS4054033.1 dephospho-CoA kinase [Thermaerobacter sp.]
MAVLIGITGGIGTGKSTVAGMLAALKVPIVDADKVAAELMQPGEDVYNEVVTHFGRTILRPNGMIDRAKLGALVFADGEKRRLLESLSHGRIWSEMMEIFRSLEVVGHCAVAFEVPLLFEAKLNQLVDEVWVVVCTHETQLQRVMARDLSEEEALVRMATQMPLAEKIELAHRVIYTEGSLGDTKMQVERYYMSICGGEN